MPRRIETPSGFAHRMVISRAPHGGRVVVTGHFGARVVSYGPHRGFVEHPLRPGYISRTYVIGGRSYAYVYREYRYYGVVYYNYVPPVYYSPAYYVWAGNLWVRPVPYRWYGLAAPAPWYGYYSFYFAPAPVYASPALWLTDYLLAENLRLAYESQQAGNGSDNTAPPATPDANPTITPEMKALIADQVKQQLAEESEAGGQSTSLSSDQAAGGEQIPPALKQRLFIVSSNLDVEATSRQWLPAVTRTGCALTPGDTIERTGEDLDSNGKVAVKVVSSKPGDCTSGSQTAIDLASLQEMHNQFREQLDTGLKMMTDGQAEGLPSGPAANPSQVAEGIASPAPDAQSQVMAQERSAEKVESEVFESGAN
jgi:hypothetical protein